jgi:hypothetical protein
MSDANKNGTILFKEGTNLPESLSIESEPFLPGWIVVKNLSRFELKRGIEGAHWNFFYLAGETTATVFGRDRWGTLRRAAKDILAKHRGQQFNSLEITRVVSKRFLGIPFMHVVAHSRHIQESSALIPTKSFVLRMCGEIAPEAQRATGQQRDEVNVNHCAVVNSNR